jgi:tRNA threonylcarbamoyladenosine modification (KEOPS) complex Cgi121 subunit
MEPISKLEEMFFAFIEALGEAYPDGGILSENTQIEIMMHLAKVAQILNIDI